MSNANIEPSSQEHETETLERRRRYAELVRAGIDKEAQKGDDNTLDLTVESHVSGLTARYVNLPFGPAALETELHQLWYTVIQAAKHFHFRSPKQDTLVRYIMAAKARGDLTQPLASTADTTNSDRGGVVSLSNGRRFWSDLPLLGPDLVEEWTERFYRPDYWTDNYQAEGLASFVGRLISVGIYDGTAACVLSLFRETLETPRPLVASKATTSGAAAAADDQHRHEPQSETRDPVITATGSGEAETTELPVEDLIQALEQLLLHAQSGIMLLTNRRAVPAEADATTTAIAAPNDLPARVTDVGAMRLALDWGELARQSDLVASPGFSPERWQFWVQRLEELAGCDVDCVASSAEQCLFQLWRAQQATDGPLASGLRSDWTTPFTARDKTDD